MLFKKTGEIRCWACKEWMSNNELENADGFCIYCHQEIDRNDEPYVKSADGEG